MQAEKVSQVSSQAVSELRKVVDALDARFVSGNGIAIERAHIRADEWATMREAAISLQVANAQLMQDFNENRARIAALESLVAQPVSHAVPSDCNGAQIDGTTSVRPTGKTDGSQVVPNRVALQLLYDVYLAAFRALDDSEELESGQARIEPQEYKNLSDTIAGFEAAFPDAMHGAETMGITSLISQPVGGQVVADEIQSAHALLNSAGVRECGHGDDERHLPLCNRIELLIGERDDLLDAGNDDASPVTMDVTDEMKMRAVIAWKSAREEWVRQNPDKRPEWSITLVADVMLTAALRSP